MEYCTEGEKCTIIGKMDSYDRILKKSSILRFKRKCIN